METMYVDDIEVFEVLPCTYYASSASLVSDASCNGASDGSASATAVNGATGTDSVSLSYLWSDGQTTATATGLAAGTLLCSF